MTPRNIMAALNGTHEGLNDNGTDYERAQTRFRDAERNLEILPLLLRNENPGSPAVQNRFEAAYRSYAREAAALLRATDRTHPGEKIGLGQTYARLLGDLLTGKHPDSRNFWSAVWCAPYTHEDTPGGENSASIA